MQGRYLYCQVKTVIQAKETLKKQDKTRRKVLMPNHEGYSRERAWTLLHEYTQSASLLKHALAVETCVLAYGEREADAENLTGDSRDEFVEKYSVTALLHDFDYEKYPTPEEHP